VIGRLRPGASIARAQSELGAIMHRLYLQEPGPFMSKDVSIVSLNAHIVGKVRPALLCCSAQLVSCC